MLLLHIYGLVHTTTQAYGLAENKGPFLNYQLLCCDRSNWLLLEKEKQLSVKTSSARRSNVSELDSFRNKI